MKIINRGFLIVSPTQVFVDWANQFGEEEEQLQLEFCEPTVYLVEDDIYDDEELIRGKFKSIFTAELTMVCEDESVFPKITQENFYQFFNCSMGSTVIDLEKNDIRGLD